LLVLVALIVAIIVVMLPLDWIGRLFCDDDVLLLQIKSVDPSLLGQSNDPCSLLNLKAVQTVQQCMTKYYVNIQLLFDSSIVSAANYNADHKKNTENSLLKYTGALAVRTTPTTGRRDISYFRVLAELEVRGEDVAKALTQKLRNTTDVLAGLNLPGLKGLTRPLYCLEGKCTASIIQTTQPKPQTTPSPPTAGDTDSPAENPKVTASPANVSNTTSWADYYVTTSANFSTFPSEAFNDTTVSVSTLANDGSSNSTAAENITASEGI
jgi:hypothetical protein